MLTQDEIERERYESRLKKQRDDSWLPKAFRAEGSLITRIQMYQEFLRREITPTEILETKSIQELQDLATQLGADFAASR